MKAKVFKTETFGASDGPGVRLVIFFQGCTYRCLYCHNPESWELNGSKTYLLSVREIIKQFRRNQAFYMNGGITLSGGEPMLQYKFVYNLAKACKRWNIHLAIDTAATNLFGNETWYKKIAKYVDLWIVDIKSTNKVVHKQITGSEKTTGVALINLLEQWKKPYWVRYVLVKDLTNYKYQLKELGLFLSTLQYMQNYELLPYHTLALDKYKELKIKYPLAKTPVMNSKENSIAIKYLQSIVGK